MQKRDNQLELDDLLAKDGIILGRFLSCATAQRTASFAKCVAGGGTAM